MLGIYVGQHVYMLGNKGFIDGRDDQDAGHRASHHPRVLPLEQRLRRGGREGPGLGGTSADLRISGLLGRVGFDAAGDRVLHEQPASGCARGAERIGSDERPKAGDTSEPGFMVRREDERRQNPGGPH